jgi:hypothetical protein
VRATLVSLADMSLSSLIVQREIASIREIEEALARQVLYGGDFVTNLLEVSRIEEPALMPVVAESYGLGVAPIGELPRVPPEGARLVAAEVAAERSLFPLNVGQALVVAVAEPLAKEVEQELTFALALPIEQRLAPLFRIKQALSRDYGVPLEKRMARLLTKIVHKGPKIASTFPPPGDHAPKLPGRPPSKMPAPLPSLDAPRTRAAPQGTFVRRAEAPPARPMKRRRGPLTMDVAVAELEAAEERDAVFDLLFEFSRQFFDYTALFVVHGEIAEGRDAFGDGAPRDKVARVGVPLDLKNLLTAARDEKRTLRKYPERDGLDPVLMADLGREGTTECVIVPVLVRKRVVALLLGDGGPHGVDDAGVRQVEELALHAAAAFERVIVRRKLKGADGPATKVSAPPRDERPSVEELAAPIRELLAEPPPSPQARRKVTPRPIFPIDVDRSDRPPPANLLAVRKPSGAPIPREEPEPEPARTKSQSLRRAEAPPLDFGPRRTNDNPQIERELFAKIQKMGSEPPPTTRDAHPWAREDGASSPKASSPPPMHAVPPTDLSAQPIDLSTLKGNPPSSGVIAQGNPVSPIVVVTPDKEIRPIGDPDATPLAPELYDPDATPMAPSVEPVLSLSQRKGAAPPPLPEPKPMPPSEQQVSVPAHKPPSSRFDQSRVLPSVIVDVASEYVTLVERVEKGPDDDAERDLLRAGGHAMPAIMARFPGPIIIDRERLESPNLPRVAECGPIIRLVASMRRTALPFVLSHVGSQDPELRFWATYLLTELVYPDAIEAAVMRTFDEEARVRRAARAAVRALAEAHPQAVVDRLTEVLDDPRRAVLRPKAIEAIGEAREALGVPVLLPYLEGEHGAIARAALVTITRHDFGTDAKRWAAWWEANSGRHRLEWLIDSLMHEQRAIRAASSEELRLLTKEYFGYYDDLPKRERERAQARYREWWETIGRVRFSRAATRGA